MSIDSKSSFWQQHIENCRCSSLSQAQYCKKHSLALATFSYWKKKLKSLPEQSQPRFYPLTVRPTEARESSLQPAGLAILFAKNKLRVDLPKIFRFLRSKSC